MSVRNSVWDVGGEAEEATLSILKLTPKVAQGSPQSYIAILSPLLTVTEK